ncbi:tail fiber protein [bacterium]|nr:tail fiber protein [bacterium]
MKISNLITNEVNQNEYHFNKLTRNKIGILYVAPVNIVPEDCLACDGYVLKIIDYKKLHSVIGNYFNTGEEAEDEFRIPDYNITGKFLQPSKNVGISINAGLPNITGKIDASNTNANAEAFGETYPDQITGAFEGIWGYQSALPDAQGGTMLRGFDFDASRCNTIYGSSNTVQPPSQTVHICIKYK